MVSLLQFGTANQESSNKSYRINQSWDGRRKRAEQTGRPMTSLCLGWLAPEKDDGKTVRFVPIPDRVKIVREIFKMAAAGSGKRTIAKAFSHEKTWGLGKRAGRAFYESYVHKLLNDRRVLGEFVPGTNPKKKRGLKTDGQTPKREWRPAEDGEGVIKDYYPRVIGDDLWWKVRHVRSKNKGRGGGDPNAFRSLFRGLTFCGCCSPANGRPVGMLFVDKGKSSRGFEKLVCSQAIRSHDAERRRANGLPVCTHTRRYRYADLERNILFGFGSRARDLLGHENERRRDVEQEVDVLTTRIAALKKQEQKWLKAIDDDRSAPKAVMKKLSSIEAEIAAAEAAHDGKLAELNATPARGSVGKRLSELMAALKERETVEERRRLNDQLRRLIKSIVFTANENGTSTVVTTFSDGSTAKWFLPAENAPDPEESAFMRRLPMWPKTGNVAGDEVMARRLETRNWVKVRRLEDGWRAGRTVRMVDGEVGKGI
jgi:hypothetical protein